MRKLHHTLVKTWYGRSMSFPAAAISDIEPFVVDVQRRRDVTTVQPRGELDLSTIDTLRRTLDAAIAEMETGSSLVLDLRGLSFMDSTGVHLLLVLDRRAQRDGFQLTLLAPAPPIDRAIELCGLDQMLSFAAPDDPLTRTALQE